MELLVPLLLFALGSALGAGAIYYSLSGKLSEAGRQISEAERQIGVLQSERAVVDERLKTQVEVVAALEAQIDRARLKEQEAAQTALELASTKSGLDATWRRVQELTADVARRETSLKEQADLAGTLKVRQKELETRLDEQQRAFDARLEEQKLSFDARKEEQQRAFDARLEEQERAIQRQATMLAEAEKKLTDVFKSLSSDVLKQSSESFLDLAKKAFEAEQEKVKGDLEQRRVAVDALVKPIKEQMEGIGKQMQEVEKNRNHTYGSLEQMVKSMGAEQVALKKETASLVQALGKSGVRGRWGEMQLRRVVEMAGMVSYCDFAEQESVATDDGRLRPDMVVKLPGGRSIIVDSKAPMTAYWEATEAADEETRRACLQRHAQSLRSHVQGLSGKRYGDHVDGAMEFAVLFLPGEMLYSAALEQDAGLIEYGVERKVIVATPTTLIGLLNAVAFGWRQEQIADNAKRISELGQEMYDRIQKLASFVDKLRTNIDRTVSSYNQFAASFEGRFLVSARRFKELGVKTSGEIAEINPVDTQARSLSGMEVPSSPSLPEAALNGNGKTLSA